MAPVFAADERVLLTPPSTPPLGDDDQLEELVRAMRSLNLSPSRSSVPQTDRLVGLFPSPPSGPTAHRSPPPGRTDSNPCKPSLDGRLPSGHLQQPRRIAFDQWTRKEHEEIHVFGGGGLEEHTRCQEPSMPPNVWCPWDMYRRKAVWDRISQVMVEGTSHPLLHR